ncbi:MULTISPECIES: hypothetical protein [unclassified Pseudomonas]|uniref:hypothetical protein n=1 Tax=unclassified Pseudomonas TaxID=196821 RepID=UPI002447EF6B|nr:MULTISPECIES: hypothetical protein [unclassified Pseudomonas]MDH0303449.1 hypothetical protein [Pseudomonas sp. GD04091]MDH1984484.1 hypothetical protein [Pseudomonas sp. GD03689]
MTPNLRLQGLQGDLMRTATELEALSQTLNGHAVFLRHSIHQADAQAMDEHAGGLRRCASEMRGIARGIAP